MSDPYDESPPWNLPWPESPSPPDSVALLVPASGPSFASASPTTPAFTAPPIALPSYTAVTYLGQSSLAQDHARQVRIAVAKRQLGEAYWGLGSVGVWIAERAGEAAGWKEAEVPVVVDKASGGESGDGGGSGVGTVAVEEGEERVADSASGQDDDDLPVDANFYFFLLVCK